MVAAVNARNSGAKTPGQAQVERMWILFLKRLAYLNIPCCRRWSRAPPAPSSRPTCPARWTAAWCGRGRGGHPSCASRGHTRPREVSRGHTPRAPRPPQPPRPAPEASSRAPSLQGAGAAASRGRSPRAPAGAAASSTARWPASSPPRPRPRPSCRANLSRSTTSRTTRPPTRRMSSGGQWGTLSASSNFSSSLLKTQSSAKMKITFYFKPIFHFCTQPTIACIRRKSSECVPKVRTRKSSQECGAGPSVSSRGRLSGARSQPGDPSRSAAYTV